MSALAEFSKGELVKLVTQNWVGRVTVGIADAIEHSFKSDEVLRPVQTRDEIERRFKICIRWFVTMRRELHMSVPRILDEIPKALRAELDGGKYSPEQDRTSWQGNGPAVRMVTDGEDLSPPRDPE